MPRISTLLSKSSPKNIFANQSVGGPITFTKQVLEYHFGPLSKFNRLLTSKFGKYFLVNSWIKKGVISSYIEGFSNLASIVKILQGFKQLPGAFWSTILIRYRNSMGLWSQIEQKIAGQLMDHKAEVLDITLSFIWRH